MKKWKTALIIFVAILLLSILLFFLKPEDILKHIPIIKNLYQNTTLDISTPYGKAQVIINEKEYGETPLNIQSLVAGEYDVSLKRISTEEGFYKTHTFKVTLTKNSITRINMEIGADDTLHGTVLYYTEDKNPVSNKGKLTITDNSLNSKIYMNSEFLKSTPITNFEINEGEYDILFQSEGYEDLQLPVIVRNGYILNIKGYLMPIPIILEIDRNE